MKENWEIHWKDYYRILQVHQLAEPVVVKAAYNKLAQIYAPDHNNSPDALQKMKDLNEAYEILSNSVKRTAYDTSYNQKDFIIPTPPKSEVKANPNVTHYDTTQSRWQNVTQLIWCAKCKQQTNMLIAFVNERPAYGTCPICHTFWNLKAYFDSHPKPKTSSRPYPNWEE